MSDAKLNLLNKIATENGFVNPEIEIKPLSSDGANYSSELFLAVIKEPGKEDFKLFAKVACFGDKMRDMTKSFQPFKIEHFFYTKLSKIYQNLEGENSVPSKHRLAYPKYYGGSVKYNEEMFFLENLVANGFATFDRFKSVDWDYAAEAIKQLAQLHALSVAFEQKQPEEFKNICEKISPYFLLNDSIMDFIQTMSKLSLNVISKEKRGRLEKYIDKNINLEAHKAVMDKARRKVLGHGDYRPNNLLHKIDEKGLQIMVLDFQTIYFGSPLLDLVYFIFTGTDGAFRSEHLDRLIQWYRTQLTLALERLGLDHLYTEDDFNHDLQQILPLGLNLALMALPFVTVDPVDAPSMSGEQDLNSIRVKTSEHYTKRVNGIIDDFIKWGIL